MPRVVTLRSLLVVEEHEEVRAALRAWLLVSCPELRVREARSMDEALERVAQATPDLVLMNIELPGPNGIEATRQLRRREPQCPVVIMSFHDSEALRVAAIEAGARAFVPKRELPDALLPIMAGFGKMNPKVLLVDDDPAALFALHEVLSPLAAIHRARSGEEALRKMLKHDFAAVILDVRLPGMDGFEVAAAIKALQRTRDVPIIFMSAHDDRRRRQRDDSEVYFRKPLTPEVVTAKVRSLLHAQ